jgi:hypothetical protein
MAQEKGDIEGRVAKVGDLEVDDPQLRVGADKDILWGKITVDYAQSPCLHLIDVVAHPSGHER